MPCNLVHPCHLGPCPLLQHSTLSIQHCKRRRRLIRKPLRSRALSLTRLNAPSTLSSSQQLATQQEPRGSASAMVQAITATPGVRKAGCSQFHESGSGCRTWRFVMSTRRTLPAVVAFAFALVFFGLGNYLGARQNADTE